MVSLISKVALVTGASRGVGKGVAAVSLYPGLVWTEGVMAAAQFYDLSNSESPQFIGRAVAALAPEMEVYPNQGNEYCEFWLPVRPPCKTGAVIK